MKFTSIRAMKSFLLLICVAALLLSGCATPDSQSSIRADVPPPQFFLKRTQTHNKFSQTIAPVVKVPSGAVIEAETEEATDGQLSLASKSADVPGVNFEPIHPLTGPVYVEGAQPGDILAVKLHKIEIGDCTCSWLPLGLMHLNHLEG